MIRAVISDYGGVLTTPPVEGLLAYEAESGLTSDRIGRAIADVAQARGDNPFYDLERGRISEAEFGRRLTEALGRSVDMDRLRAIYFERLEPNGRMIEFMRDLRGRGLRAALLTNNIREWEPLWRAKLPELDEIFEVVVDSAFVGMRKPERGIYELTLERLGGVAPEACLFVDDLEVNCEAARTLGMHAVRFDSTEQAIAEIEDRLDSTRRSGA